MEKWKTVKKTVKTLFYKINNTKETGERQRLIQTFNISQENNDWQLIFNIEKWMNSILLIWEWGTHKFNQQYETEEAIEKQT
jgi:hypothetical protein